MTCVGMPEILMATSWCAPHARRAPSPHALGKASTGPVRSRIPSRPFAALASRRTACVACAAFLLVHLVPLSTQAATVSFSVRIDGDPRIANTPLSEHRGVAYVSLSRLVEAWGGACTISPQRVQVDFAAKTAWMSFNDTWVNASLARFSLTYPILQRETEVLMAFYDVASFFENAFLLSINKERAAGPQPDTAARSTVEPPASEPEMDALEPLRTARDRAPGVSPIEIVIIDPGHGGADTGSEGQGGLLESELCFTLAQRLQGVLRQLGVATFLTRDRDLALSHAQRASVANSKQGGLLVSLHAGASYAESAHGFEVFCCNATRAQPGLAAEEGPRAGPGRDYADASWEIAARVTSATEQTTGAESRGAWQIDSPLLEAVSMPGFLIEVGFLTNPAEEALLQTTDYQQKIAQGIAAGLKDYLKINTRGGTP